MQNKNTTSIAELEDGEFALGYIRGCLDTAKRFHRSAFVRVSKAKPGEPPRQLPPSFIIVIRRTASLLFLAALSITLCACTGPRPQHGGKAVTTGGITQTLLQGENPSEPSRQTQDTFRTRTYAFPSSSFSSSSSFDDRVLSPTLSHSNARTLLTDVEETHATTELGASQKDTAREFTAKLSSLKSIVWVGLGLFIFGLGSLFWPPLRTIIGSVTTSAAITLGGVGLMILPTLVVGHELYILGAVTLAVAGWFLAHRHGHARGQLAAHTRARAAVLSTAPARRSSH